MKGSAIVFPGMSEVITDILLHCLDGIKVQTLLLTSNNHSWIFSGVVL